MYSNFQKGGRVTQLIYFKQGEKNQPFVFNTNCFSTAEIREHTLISHKDLVGRNTLTEDHCDENNSTDSFTGQHE